MRIISGKARGTKLYTLEGFETRPTLDRVKESIFNIINSEIHGTNVLDLFAGCGAIGLEFISRGAKTAILCDKSKEAINIIERNVKKTHFENETKIYNCDFKEVLNSQKKCKFDFIYIDPPYKTKFISESIKIIIENDLLDDDGTIIAETDEIDRVIKEIQNLNIKIIDQRKYGRAHIIFMKKV